MKTSNFVTDRSRNLAMRLCELDHQSHVILENIKQKLGKVKQKQKFQPPGGEYKEFQTDMVILIRFLKFQRPRYHHIISDQNFCPNLPVICSIQY